MQTSTISKAPPESHGWLKDESGYSIDWEAPDKYRPHWTSLLRDVPVKTGCKTKQCRCQKNGRGCGAGCECKGCTNIILSIPQEQEEGQRKKSRMTVPAVKLKSYKLK